MILTSKNKYKIDRRWCTLFWVTQYSSSQPSAQICACFDNFPYSLITHLLKNGMPSQYSSTPRLLFIYLRVSSDPWCFCIEQVCCEMQRRCNAAIKTCCNRGWWWVFYNWPSYINWHQLALTIALTRLSYYNIALLYITLPF